MIRADGLEKDYGEKRVLRGLDFELERGGFLVVTGANGSGKTTLLRLCAGLAIPTGGSLEVEPERGAIGFLGHEPLVYRELTALENLDLYRRLYRVPERRERIGMLLERFGLWESRRERAAKLSRGQLQRLALCRSLLHKPELLILDEIQLVRAEDHAHPACTALAEDVGHGRDAHRVQAGERLVQDEQLRVVEQHTREAETLLHAAGEGRDALVPDLPEPEALEQHPHPLTALANPVQPGEQR